MRPLEATYDVVVVGGGPAGAAAAITLARAGVRVLLAEALGSMPFKIGESLPPAAIPLLRDLGITPEQWREQHSPNPGNVTTWGGTEKRDHDFGEIHGAGWNLDRPRFDLMLREAAALAGTEVRTACCLTHFEFTAGRSQWELAFGEANPAARISARWLLDATGRRGIIATRCGAEAVRHDRLVAYCAVLPEITSGEEMDGRTFIESVEDGWWYSALLPRGRRMVVFFTDDDLLIAQVAREPGGFCRLLAGTRHLREGDARLSAHHVGRIRRFSACSMSRTLFGGPGWLALGDASLAFDPLSSQGISHALHTGLRGAKTALAAMVGDETALPAWHEQMSSIHERYQHHLAQCYGAESRWRHSCFWLRRHEGRPVEEGIRPPSPFESVARGMDAAKP